MFFRKRPKDSLLQKADPTGSSRPSVMNGVAPAPSILGRNTRFRGEVRGRGPLVIRGQVQGTVKIEDRLIVEAGGVLDAETFANEALIGGSVLGDLQVRGTLAVRATGILEGRLRARRLRVEEGAVLKGTVSRGESQA